VTDVKDRMFDLNETINWKPKSTGEGRFGNWLKNVNDWNLPVQDIGEFLCQFGEQMIKKKKFIGSVEELYNEIEKSIEAGFHERKSFQRF
jgi:isoleucyl-tRNA synthetase